MDGAGNLGSCRLGEVGRAGNCGSRSPGAGNGVRSAEGTGAGNGGNTEETTLAGNGSRAAEVAGHGNGGRLAEVAGTGNIIRPAAVAEAGNGARYQNWFIFMKVSLCHKTMPAALNALSDRTLASERHQHVLCMLRPVFQPGHLLVLRVLT